MPTKLAASILMGMRQSGIPPTVMARCCRHCLENIAVGEPYLILTQRLVCAPQPYAASPEIPVMLMESATMTVCD